MLRCSCGGGGAVGGPISYWHPRHWGENVHQIEWLTRLLPCSASQRLVSPPKERVQTCWNCFETLRNPETKTCDASNLAGSKSPLHYASLTFTKTFKIVSWQLQNNNHKSPCYGAGYDPGVGQSIPSQILTTIMPKWCKIIQHLQTCQANPSKASSTSAFGMDVQIDGSCRVSWRSERPWNHVKPWT